MERGTVWWAQLPEPIASEPGFRRPVIIIQALRGNEWVNLPRSSP
ncbi:MAG: type II toxin-antitoxin system PemK/MazF family toxin [bacterium]|nr:type II toxin-antitoxin system PemK/MazF family toxin [bacterium]